MPSNTKYIVNGAQLTDIGDAIRSKLGEQDTYTVDEMPEKISEISSVSGNIEITENGENINVAPYATATVNVSGGGDLPVGKCTVTIVNSAESTMNIDFRDSATPISLLGGYTAFDNKLITSSDYFLENSIIITPGNSLTVECYYTYEESSFIGINYVEHSGFSYTASNIVNMTLNTFTSEGDTINEYTSTDLTADSSITLTVVHTI